MKPHRTVTITKRMLKKAGACRQGVAAVEHLLPATLSTDPERNLEIALGLADSTPALRDNFDAAHWLMGTYSGEYNPLPNDHLLVGLYHQTQRDAWVTAQYLAWAADGLLTKAGR